MIEVSGSFSLTSLGGEDELEAIVAPRLTHAWGGQAFSGGIEGTGRVDWLFAYRADRTAAFVGLQQIEGTLDGRRGAFVLRSTGSHDGRTSEGRWEIVEGSGSADLGGLRGEGEWTAGPGPQGSYRLRYELG